MFTGIVESLGRIDSVVGTDAGRRLRIDAPPEIIDGLGEGDSVSVDGACLTAVEVDSGGFIVDVMGTTLTRTTAAEYVAGRRVNLERALRFDGRLDGHLLQGHVDGIGHLRSIREESAFRILAFSVPREVHRLTIPHGSIALNGVSLTVNALRGDDRVEVAIIPHTWRSTNLRDLRVGDPVNVEGDLIGKYVGKLLGAGIRGFRTGLQAGPSSASGEAGEA